MIFRKQLFRHRPAEGQFGDCHRTAIACLLDLEPDQVPNFGEHFGNAKAFNEACDAWLRTRGLALVDCTFNADLEAVLNYQKAMNPWAYYLLGGTSRNGCNHTVVGKGGEIIHDPAQDNSGIVGPCSDGFFWISYFVPSSMVDDSQRLCQLDRFYEPDPCTE